MDYDTLAADYARHRQVHPEVLRALLAGGRVQSGSRVLEVGCGTGNYLAAIQAASGCACRGIDPSVEMLARAGERLPDAELRLGRAEALPFPDGAFDLVFSVDVIHHVQDRAAYYREAWRVLAPGGRVCTVTDSEEIIRGRTILAGYFPETVQVELARYPRIADLRSLMGNAGFTGIQEEVVSFSCPVTDAAPYRARAFSSLHLISEEAFQRGLGACPGKRRVWSQEPDSGWRIRQYGTLVPPV